MARIGPFGYVGQRGVVCPVCGAAAQDKPPVAIAAVDITVLVNLQPHLRMAKSRRAKASSATNGAGAIATDAAVIDKDDFWRGNAHGPAR